MFKKTLLHLLNLSILIPISYSARILGVFPAPFHSHQSVFRPLILELARRGHDVVFITTDPAREDNLLPNLKEIDIHDVSYEFRNNFPMKIRGRADDVLEQVDSYNEMFRQLLEVQIKTPLVHKIINDKYQRFDLLIIEACMRSALVFSHVFKAPVITISTLGLIGEFTEYLGIPNHPILYSNSLQQKYNLTLWEKTKKLYTYYQLNRIQERHAAKENEMFKKNFGDDVPALSELKKNVAMLMINVHHVWEESRPTPANVIFLGGLHLETNYSKELSTDLKSYLDSSKHGVIYVSFGTLIMPSLLDNMKILIKAFSKLQYDILLKWDEDSLPGCPNNIKLMKWVPQRKLLQHPNVKLFITQGGMQSTDEAIAAGVPVIGIPIIVDQWYNVEKYVHLEIGVKIELETMTEKKLIDAVNTVITDKSYKRNIIALRKLMYDQPQTSLQRAVWWTEYILRHGRSPHLMSPAAHMSSWDFFEIDLLLVLVSCILAILSTTVYVGLKIYKKLWKSSANAKLKIR